MAVDTVSSLLFTGPLTWTGEASCAGQTELFFAPAGERPETRLLREARARAICMGCEVVDPCRRWAREHREYGFWGGESEEDRAGRRLPRRHAGRPGGPLPQGQRHPRATRASRRVA